MVPGVCAVRGGRPSVRTCWGYSRQVERLCQGFNDPAAWLSRYLLYSAVPHSKGFEGPCVRPTRTGVQFEAQRHLWQGAVTEARLVGGAS